MEKKNKAKDFQIGDEVIIVDAIANDGFGAKPDMIGRRGIVRKIRRSAIGLEFNNSHPLGHNLRDASVPTGFGWFVRPEEITLHRRATGRGDEQAAHHPTPLLPSDAADRKKIPIGTGVLDYFPAAMVEIAKVSQAGNDQHNPGQPLHWARQKSTDQADTIIRHFLERGGRDSDGHRHSAKLAWRALALLQIELEEAGAPLARGAKNG